MPIPKIVTDTDRAVSVAFNFTTKKHHYIIARNLAAKHGTQMQKIQNDWIEAEREVLSAEKEVESAEKELDDYLKEIGYSGSRVAFIHSVQAEWESNTVPMDMKSFFDECDSN